MAEDKKEKEEEVVNVRHTISAEETFTLAKDVFDIRCFIKNVYANRAVISRRLDILTLSISTVFMLLYTAFVAFNSLTRKLSVQVEIVLYVMLGVYAALFLAFLIVYACSTRAHAKSVRKYKTTLKIFKIAVRCLAIAVSIAAMVFAGAGEELSAQNMAVDIVIIIVSVITLIFQLIPLMFGGTAKLVRWLLSPVKTKYRFSKVTLEWYELAVTGGAREGAVKKVSKKYFEDIGVLIDSYLVPQLGSKYITAIKPAMLLNLVDKAPDEDKLLLEGVLKSVFAYAAECGYVTFDPCKDLPFEGSVEEPEKPQKQTIKGRLLKVGQKIGMSMLDKYISGSEDKD
ncbi:MAG: hypothetical protein K2K80_01380 [Clostridia bacterium]|nr:hypothetical protein [Clostridia bacterium]